LEGATVCRSCGREQPLTPEESAKRTINWALFAIASVVVAVVVGLLGWYGLDQMARANAIERVVACARLHGDKELTADFANSQVDVGMQQTGKSWRAGMEYAALEFESWGEPSTGVCFITQETLFSN
jgi:hypothetical protein